MATKFAIKLHTLLSGEGGGMGWINDHVFEIQTKNPELLASGICSSKTQQTCWLSLERKLARYGFQHLGGNHYTDPTGRFRRTNANLAEVRPLDKKGGRTPKFKSAEEELAFQRGRNWHTVGRPAARMMPQQAQAAAFGMAQFPFTAGLPHAQQLQYAALQGTVAKQHMTNATVRATAAATAASRQAATKALVPPPVATAPPAAVAPTPVQAAPAPQPSASTTAAQQKEAHAEQREILLASKKTHMETLMFLKTELGLEKEDPQYQEALNDFMAVNKKIKQHDQQGYDGLGAGGCGKVNINEPQDKEDVVGIKQEYDP